MASRTGLTRNQDADDLRRVPATYRKVVFNDAMNIILSVFQYFLLSFINLIIIHHRSLSSVKHIHVFISISVLNQVNARYTSLTNNDYIRTLHFSGLSLSVFAFLSLSLPFSLFLGKTDMFPRTENSV